MPDYDAISWLPLTAGLTGAGLLLSWLAWRRRGLPAGLRGLSWSLLPIAAYLTGLLELVWRVVEASADWVVHLVFSPTVWLGVVLAGVAMVLFLVSGRLAKRRPASPVGQGAKRRLHPTAQPSGDAPPAARAQASDDFAEIEQILRRRGIS